MAKTATTSLEWSRDRERVNSQSDGSAGSHPDRPSQDDAHSADATQPMAGGIEPQGRERRDDRQVLQGVEDVGSLAGQANPIRRPLQVLTHSSESTFKTCPRKFYLRYRLGLVPRHDSDALRIGSAYHAGLEAWKLTRDANAARQAVSDLYASSPCPPWLTFDEFETEHEIASSLVHGYTKRYADDLIVEHVAVELKFDLPIRNPSNGRAHDTLRNQGKIDEIGRLPDGRLAVIEHKCVAGDSLIFNHYSGTYERADVLYQRRIAPVVTAMNSDGEIVTAQASCLRTAGVRPIRRIQTLGGRVLRVSGNHPVWTSRGWVLAENILSSDWLGTPRKMTGACPDAPITDQEVRLIGYMIGDGCTSNMMFTKSDESVLNDVISCASSVGESVQINRPRTRTANVRFSMAKIGRYENKIGPVGILMTRAGLSGVGSSEKRLPFHLALSDRQLGQLIGALWSTDGCIDSTARNDGIHKLRVIYTSVSLGLCLDIQNALQRLGIISNVRTTSVAYKGERRPVSTVQIVSRSAKREFLSLVSDGIIPLTRSRLSVADAKALIPTSKQGGDAIRQPYLSNDIWWDRVESVRWDEEEETYDLTVPEVHTFVVDGIITHNTAGESIELGGDYWRRCRMDAQISRYYLAARELGYDVSTVVYDVARKPQIRPKAIAKADRAQATAYGRYFDQTITSACPERETPDLFGARLRADIAERPDHYYQRAEIPRLESDLDDFAAEQWQIAQQIVAGERFGRFYRNTNACTSPYRCTYFDVCSNHSLDSIQQTTPDGFKRADVLHPELVTTETA